jgi:hypothetical protein
MFLAIDRVSKFTVVAFHQSAGKMEGAAFLRHVVATFPYALHTVLTDDGMAFATLLGPPSYENLARYQNRLPPQEYGVNMNAGTPCSASRNKNQLGVPELAAAALLSGDDPAAETPG